MSDDGRRVRTNRARRALTMSEMGGAQAVGVLAWEPNWIDYRASRARIDRRAERGDLAERCGECHCEVDVTPQPHSPKCSRTAA